jgi:mannose-6-phosphate isomerase-like protein (cupin superfamily)
MKKTTTADEFEEQFSVVPVSTDARGVIYELNVDKMVHINVLTLSKGYARGGHSHIYPEVFYLVTGRVQFHTGELGKERVFEYGPSAKIRTTLGEPHYMYALEDSTYLEIRPAGTAYQAKEYAPFRSIVTDLMNRK